LEVGVLRPSPLEIGSFSRIVADSDHQTASETGLPRTSRVSYEGTYTRFGVFVLLTPLFFVLPYWFMTPPSGPGGPVTQMSPLLYPSD